MAGVPVEARELIESGPLGHLVTLNRDGSPQVTCIWLASTGTSSCPPTWRPTRGSSGTCAATRACRSSSRARAYHPPGLKEYFVVHGRARVEEGGAPELLQRLAHVYLGPDASFPPTDDPPPGYTMHVSVERVDGVGPWT